MSEEATTLVARGESGALLVVDVPTSAGRREIFDDQVAKGHLTVLGLAPAGVEVDERNQLVAGRTHEGGFVKTPGTPVDLDTLAPWSPAAADPTPAASMARPARSAPKDAWVLYLALNGHDEGELVAMSKADLLALADEDPTGSDDDDMED